PTSTRGTPARADRSRSRSATCSRRRAACRSALRSCSRSRNRRSSTTWTSTRRSSSTERSAVSSARAPEAARRSPTMRAIPPAVLAAAALVALASGCGGGGGKTAETATTTAATTGKTTTTTVAATETAPANAKVTVVSGRLSAALVVPKKGPANAAGTVVIRLDPRAQKACWTLTLTGVSGALSAHVHFGKGKQLGPVVIPLGDRYAPRGCVLVPVRSLQAVAKAPGSYYVDVHTTKYL